MPEFTVYPTIMTLGGKVSMTVVVRLLPVITYPYTNIERVILILSLALTVSNDGYS